MRLWRAQAHDAAPQPSPPPAVSAASARDGSSRAVEIEGIPASQTTIPGQSQCTLRDLPCDQRPMFRNAPEAAFATLFQP